MREHGRMRRCSAVFADRSGACSHRAGPTAPSPVPRCRTARRCRPPSPVRRRRRRPNRRRQTTRARSPTRPPPPRTDRAPTTPATPARDRCRPRRSTRDRSRPRRCRPDGSAGDAAAGDPPRSPRPTGGHRDHGGRRRRGRQHRRTTWWLWVLLAALVVDRRCGARSYVGRGPKWPEKVTALLDEVDGRYGEPVGAHPRRPAVPSHRTEAAALAALRARLRDLVAAGARRSAAPHCSTRSPQPRRRPAHGASARSRCRPTMPDRRRSTRASLRAAAVLHTTSATARVSLGSRRRPLLSRRHAELETGSAGAEGVGEGLQVAVGAVGVGGSACGRPRPGSGGRRTRRRHQVLVVGGDLGLHRRPQYCSMSVALASSPAFAATFSDRAFTSASITGSRSATVPVGSVVVTATVVVVLAMRGVERACCRPTA